MNGDNGLGPSSGILHAVQLRGITPALRRHKARQPGCRQRHACANNHIGPANCGAAIAAATAAQALSLPGGICVIDCPAEEILWGKIALQAAGVFGTFDVLPSSHGNCPNGAPSRPCHAVVPGECALRGDSAHAGMAVARNALGAAEDAMAAFMAEVDRIPWNNETHAFRMAGIMPGVMPDEVRLWCRLRHRDLDPVMAAYRGMEALFRAVAARTGVGVED